MLNLMGLHKEGILAETEVSAFRSHLLDTLIASPTEREQSAILRDKLLFLQVNQSSLFSSSSFSFLSLCFLSNQTGIIN